MRPLLSALVDEFSLLLGNESGIAGAVRQKNQQYYSIGKRDDAEYNKYPLSIVSLGLEEKNIEVHERIEG